MKVIMSSRAWQELRHLSIEQPQLLPRAFELIEDIRRHPFSGLGKPEPLKGTLRGFWSRRLSKVDRIVYRVSGAEPDAVLEIARLLGHYD